MGRRLALGQSGAGRVLAWGAAVFWSGKGNRQQNARPILAEWRGDSLTGIILLIPRKCGPLVDLGLELQYTEIIQKIIHSNLARGLVRALLKKLDGA